MHIRGFQHPNSRLNPMFEAEATIVLRDRYDNNAPVLASEECQTPMPSHNTARGEKSYAM